MDWSSPSAQLRKSKSSKLGASYKTTLSLHHDVNTNTALQTSFFSSLLSLALSLTSSALFQGNLLGQQVQLVRGLPHLFKTVLNHIRSKTVLDFI